MSEKLLKNDKVMFYEDLKYNIKLRYDRSTPGKKRAVRLHMIPRYCPEATFYDYLNIKKTDSRDIPGEVLKQFADLFSIPIEMLFTDKT